MRENLERFDELAALLARAPDREAEHRAAAARQQRARERAIGMLGQLWIADGLDHLVRRKKRNDPARVVDMALHAQRQRLDALQNLECRHRRHARAEIADALAPRPQQERGGGRLVGEHHVVKAGIRLGQRGKFSGALARFSPVEPPAVDEQPADDHAVTGEKFRRRVINEVGAVLERPHQVRRRECRVDEQRQAVLVRELRHARDIEHLEPGVAQRFTEQQACIRAQRGAPGVEVARVDERRLDAEPGQREIEQVMRPAVERARRDDVRARSHQRDDGEMQRGLPARHGDRTHAVFERANPLLEHRARGVGDARVHVARTLHVEQRRSVIAVAENE